MLHVCGGTGYKRDMELERYLRDARPGWVMGPDERGCCARFVGKAVLLGLREPLDYWNSTQPPRGSRTSSRSSTQTGQSASSPRSCFAEAEALGRRSGCQ